MKLINISETLEKELITKYSKENLIRKLESDKSLKIFIPPELVIKEIRRKARVLKELDGTLNCNWVTAQKVEAYLYESCKIGGQEYYDLFFLNINDTDYRPECTNCGKELNFQTIMSGYGHHATFQSENLFCSQSCNQLYYRRINGKFGIREEYTSSKTGITYLAKSKLEYEVFGRLDFSEEIASWYYEPFEIFYVFNEEQHSYLPDILINFANGKRALAEIKYNKHLNDEVSQAKLQALKNYCELNGYEFRIITESTFDIIADPYY